MKEIVFYKKMDIILRYRSVPADVKRTDTENIPGRG